MSTWNQFIIDNLIEIIALVVALIGSFATIIWQIAIHKMKYDKACDEVDNLNEKFSSTTESLNNIDGKISSLTETITAFIGGQSGAFESHSPVSLTETGLQMVVNSGFPNILENRKKFFIKNLSNYKINDEAGLDDACWDFLYKTTDQEIDDQLKVAAYESGVELPVLKKACSLYLRDQIKSDILKE